MKEARRAVTSCGEQERRGLSEPRLERRGSENIAHHSFPSCRCAFVPLCLSSPLVTASLGAFFTVAATSNR